MAKPFSSNAIGSSGPALGAIVITPADGSDLPSDVRAVTIGGAGTIAYTGWDGLSYATASLPIGTYAMCARRILSTGTTATVITGWV